MNSKAIERLKNRLDKLYQKYSKEAFYKQDPIIFPKRFKSDEDIEVVAIIASSLAYGRVNLFMPVIEKIIQKMGKSPSEFLKNFELKKDAKRFSDIYYRLSKSNDILAQLYALSETLKHKERLKNLFMSNFNPNGKIKDAIISFINYFQYIDLSRIFKKDAKTKGYLHLFPSPEKDSTCKRINLFLRWMVRDKDIDFGIWNEVGSYNLIIPLDTHVAKVSRCLGLLTRNSTDWKAAEELTFNLKKFAPEDPLKYDFALCHVGINGECNDKNCNSCWIKNDLSF